jgi:hypothetical protein
MEFQCGLASMLARVCWLMFLFIHALPELSDSKILCKGLSNRQGFWVV